MFAVILFLASALVVDAKLPAGNVVLEKVEGDQVFLRQDLRDSDRNWFYWKFRVTGAEAHFAYGPARPAKLPELDAARPVIVVTDDNGREYRFPNVNGDAKVLCREVATERDLLYVGGVFYELPAENAGGFSELRPIALAEEPVRTITVERGLVVVNGRRMALDSLWRNGTAAEAYWLWKTWNEENGKNWDPYLSVLISDIHLQTDPEKAYSFTAGEFPKRVREILAMRPLPSRVICFGDMAFDAGEPESYAYLREQFKPLENAGLRIVLGMGNHDRRANFLKAFPEAAQGQPVAGRFIYKVDLGTCDLILLDSLNEPVPMMADEEERDAQKPKKKAKSQVDGMLGAEQEEWLLRELAAAKRPVILGAHHAQTELTVGGRRFFQVMRDSDKVVGWINGHEHCWQKSNLCWGGGTNEDVIRALMLPTGGAWGEIGLVTLRTYPDRAVATLKMIDMVWHDALKEDETRPKVFDTIVSEQDGDRITFPFERPMLRLVR